MELILNKEKINDLKVIDSMIKENKTKTNHLKEIKKEVQEPLEPTRYGDWEKNGRCIDF